VSSVFCSTSLRDVKSWVPTINLKVASNKLREIFQVRRWCADDD